MSNDDEVRRFARRLFGTHSTDEPPRMPPRDNHVPLEGRTPEPQSTTDPAVRRYVGELFGMPENSTGLDTTPLDS